MNRQLYRYHEKIGYTFIPDLKARVPHEGGGYLIRTNNVGFRSEIDFVCKKKEKKRVLLFGDSYTAGDGVSNKMRYSDQLANICNDFEIYNFGLPGSGSDQQYLIYKEYAEEIEHDLVIIVILVENIRRVNAKYRFYENDRGQRVCYHKPYYEIDRNNGLYLRNIPVPRAEIPYENLDETEKGRVEMGGRFYWLRSGIAELGAIDLLQRLTRYQPLPEYNKPNNPEWLLLRAILTKWVGELRKPVIVIPLPLHQYIEETSDPRPYQDRFAEFSKDLGVSVHDPLSDLLVYSKKDRRNFRFKSDAHPTPAGHTALAKSFIGPIRDMLNNKKEVI